MDFYKLLSYRILENSVEQILTFFLILFLGFVFKALFAFLFTRFVHFITKKYNSKVTIEEIFEILKPPLIFLTQATIFLLAFKQLHYPQAWHLAPDSVWGVKKIVRIAFTLWI
ncbi:MAG: hypothetical protein NZ108_07130, partial [Bacteroidia bacterium]|nr:hypothetical protein [Bacteroidia bacterium]